MGANGRTGSRADVFQQMRHDPRLRTALAVPLQVRRRMMQRRHEPVQAVLDRLAELVRDDVVLHVPEIGADFAMDPRSALFQRVVAEGRYEPALLDLFGSLVAADRDVLDVGANIGFYTVHAARRVTPGRRVLAVEPTRAAHDRLVANVARNGCADAVSTEQLAVAEAPGRLTMQVVEGQEEYSSLGDLVHPSTDRVRPDAEVVDVTTLDELVGRLDLRPGLVKVDVEGAELRVLQGATETLRRFRPTLLLECSDPLLRVQGGSAAELVAWADHAGYDCSDPLAPGLEPGLRTYGDLLLTPRD